VEAGAGAVIMLTSKRMFASLPARQANLDGRAAQEVR